MAILISIINAHESIEIPDNLIILSIENWFVEDKVIFQDDNASCHSAKGIKAFRRETYIKSMI